MPVAIEPSKIEPRAFSTYTIVLGSISEVLGSTIVLGSISEVLGSICDVLGCISDVLGSINEVLGSISDVLGSTSEVLGSISDVLGSTSEVLGSTSEVLDSLSDVLGSTSEVLGSTSEVLGSISEVLGSTSEVLGSTSEVLGSTSEVLGSTSEVLGSTSEVLGSISEVLGSTSEVLGSTSEVLGSTREVLGSISDVLGSTSEVLGSTSEVLGSTSEVLGSTSEVLGSTSEVLGSTSEVLGSTSEVLGSTSEVLGSTSEVLGSTSEVLGSTSDVLGSTSEKDGPSLPSYDALARILPDNTTTAPAGETEEPQSNRHINQTYQKHTPHKRAPLPDFEDDLQSKEVENYRTAMRKMAEDIIALRTQVVTLGTDNSQLRSDLTLHQDLGRHLLDDTDVDVMTKAEIADRIASLKFKLASESSKASAQKDKIQQLQNDLIRKNDSEKELLRLQRAHQQQQTVLQRYHRTVSKTAGLEATVKQQEKIIEKMEKLLDNTLAEKSKDNAERKMMMKMKPTGEEDNRKEIATAAENSRLRGELDKIHSQPPQAAIIIQPAQVFPDRERLSLLSKLEKAETRVRTLEKQLEDNSKRWGRQKQDMLTRLSEHIYGLDRTSSTIAHDLPLVHDLPLKRVSDSVLERTRQRELKPVKK
ncbi:uncharacterized protein ccdc33 [Oncorhynchus tshawytscha]|uniref:uncharacterized protein ccdc33 n=1 Tax=Oncorhynchus tshawytscha TaxID=74940 RepID=UPI001C3C6AE2|nr:uncharacterized protein ccdc33 [Oncorhynchus tshawytscha]